MEVGKYLGFHWERFRVHPGQVASPSQVQHKETMLEFTTMDCGVKAEYTNNMPTLHRKAAAMKANAGPSLCDHHAGTIK